MPKRASSRPDANGGRVTRARFAFLALTCAVLTACGGGQVPPAQNYATIRGRAYDAATNQPVAGVTVTVDTILTATTAGDGTYRVANVPLGQYSLTASASGYAQPSGPQFAGSVGAGETITVDIPLTKS
jgi:Carboxypeptidase regulatory-like domain